MRAGNRRKEIAIMVLLVLALVMMSSSSLAIGIAPSKRIYDFKPGETVKYGIDIVNNGQQELDVTLYARGDLAENVELSRQVLTLSSDEQSKHVEVEFTMPDKLKTAGLHTVDIVAVGSTVSPDNQGAVVKADIAVVSKLVVDVPYPKKYAEARVHVLDTEEGRPVVISVPVFNKGKKDLESVHVEAKVLDPDGGLVDELTSESRPLKAGKDHKFTLQATKEYETGVYKAEVTVHYDGTELEVETGFNVGELKIDLRSLVVDEFTLGSVAKFDILLYNKWSTELKNVYAEMRITDQDNKEYADFKTVATDIAPKQVARLEGYWYTKDVMPGVYTATVVLHYANRLSQKVYELEVHPDKIVTREVGVTGKAITSGEELDLRNNAFLIIIILGMAVVIGVLVWKLRKSRQKGGGEGAGEGGDKDG
jgi:hypothetical protein